MSTHSFQKIDSLIDNSIKDCHKNCSHTIRNRLVYDIKFTNISNNEKLNSTISDKIMGWYGLNENLAVDRQKSLYLIK